MINVIVEYNRKQISTITVEGHANAGRHGEDLVCAAVSAVTFGSVNSILELTTVKLIIDMNDDGGFLRFSVPDGISEEQEKNVQLLLKALMVSLKTIELDNKKYINITHKK